MMTTSADLEHPPPVEPADRPVTEADGQDGSELPLVTLSVSVRNGSEHIDDCMRALVAQSWRPLEIVAVDDGSSDGGADILASWHDPSGSKPDSNGVPIRVLTRASEGLSAGRNAAFEASRGEWFAITDIDCRPAANWLEEMMNVRHGLGDERVAAVTGRTVFDKGRTRVSRLRSAEIERKYRGRSRIATLANGPCSMFRHRMLVSVGGFDADWYHAEDMEVSLLLITAGGTIIHTPYAVVDHVAEETLRLFLRKRRRDARAHMRIVRKHGLGGPVRPDGERLGHDFTADAKWAALVLPMHILLYALLFCLLTWLKEPILRPYPTPLLAALPLLFNVIVDRDALIRLFWSAAIWLGISDGYTDALLARNGHPRLFSKW